MRRIVIDLHSPEPSYQQVARQLRDAIMSGEIPPREALPSIQYLVQETGLAVNTIRRAVGVLIEEGLAYTVPGRGTYAGKPGGPALSVLGLGRIRVGQTSFDLDFYPHSRGFA
jgi:DNA-binding GntR family transcriptional regulator